MDIPDSEIPGGKITEKTMFSIYIVALVVTATIWVVRINDKVEAQDKVLSDLRDSIKDCAGRLSTIEGVLRNGRR